MHFLWRYEPPNREIFLKYKKLKKSHAAGDLERQQTECPPWKYILDADM